MPSALAVVLWVKHLTAVAATANPIHHRAKDHRGDTEGLMLYLLWDVECLQFPTESVFSMRKYIMWLTSVVYQLCKGRPLFQKQSLFQSQKPQALLGNGCRLGVSCPSQPLNLLIKKRSYLDCLSCLWWESYSCLLMLQPFPVTTFY